MILTSPLYPIRSIYQRYPIDLGSVEICFVVSMQREKDEQQSLSAPSSPFALQRPPNNVSNTHSPRMRPKILPRRLDLEDTLSGTLSEISKGQKRERTSMDDISPDSEHISHIVFVLDISASMSIEDADGGRRSRLAAVFDCCELFVAHQLSHSNGPRDLYSIILFDYEAVTRMHAEPLDQHLLDKIRQLAMIAKPRGATYFGCAMKELENLIQQVDADSHRVVFLSDGRPHDVSVKLNDACPTVVVLNRLYQKLGKNLKFHTVAVGDDQAEVLPLLAEMVDGKHHSSTFEMVPEDFDDAEEEYLDDLQGLFDKMHLATKPDESSVSTLLESFANISLDLSSSRQPEDPFQRVKRRAAEDSIESFDTWKHQSDIHGSTSIPCKRAVWQDGIVFEECEPLMIRKLPFFKDSNVAYYHAWIGQKMYTAMEFVTHSETLCEIELRRNDWAQRLVASLNEKIKHSDELSCTIQVGKRICIVLANIDQSERWIILQPPVPHGMFLKHPKAPEYQQDEYLAAIAHLSYAQTCDKVCLIEHKETGMVTVHSNAKSYGPDDFGALGVSTFVKSHKCGMVCHYLGLKL